MKENIGRSGAKNGPMWWTRRLVLAAEAPAEAGGGEQKMEVLKPQMQTSNEPGQGQLDDPAKTDPLSADLQIFRQIS